jgi:hypothetical protein
VAQSRVSRRDGRDKRNFSTTGTTKKPGHTILLVPDGRHRNAHWLVEAPAADRVGIYVPGDGGLFQRICTKLCTGGGKTTVMAMLIAWQVCNKTTYPQDKRSRRMFHCCPRLDSQEPLAGSAHGGDENYYTQLTSSQSV